VLKFGRDIRKAAQFLFIVSFRVIRSILVVRPTHLLSFIFVNTGVLHIVIVYIINIKYLFYCVLTRLCISLSSSFFVFLCLVGVTGLSNDCGLTVSILLRAIVNHFVSEHRKYRRDQEVTCSQHRTGILLVQTSSQYVSVASNVSKITTNESSTEFSDEKVLEVRLLVENLH
jgi:hypothetical protein